MTQSETLNSSPRQTARVALVTGGSAGLGLALTEALVRDGWQVIVDARDGDRLDLETSDLGDQVLRIAGDVADAVHREQLVAAVREAGRLDLLVNNASTLGPTPLPALTIGSAEALDHVWRVNVAAPLAVTTTLLPILHESDGVLISISSDAAKQHYEGWGLYGATKAALDHLTLTLAAENPGLVAYAVDPGDMRTAMHQAAFPGEDISDRPLPHEVVSHFMTLIAQRPAAGRYLAAEVRGREQVPTTGVVA